MSYTRNLKLSITNPGPACKGSVKFSPPLVGQAGTCRICWNEQARKENAYEGKLLRTLSASRLLHAGRHLLLRAPCQLGLSAAPLLLLPALLRSLLRPLP